MKASWIVPLTSWARSLHRTLGASGFVGLALSLIALAIALAELRPMRAEIRTLQRALQQPTLASFTMIVGSPPESSAAERMLQSLPDAQELGPILIAFSREAQRNQLAFTTAEYHWTPSTGTNFGEYEIRFDATGSYFAVRQFCAGVLNTQSAMSLRQLALSRESISDTLLKARMHWVILVRDGDRR